MSIYLVSLNLVLEKSFEWFSQVYHARLILFAISEYGGDREFGERLQMIVKRIVANVQSSDPGKGKAFYEDLLGMPVVMDQGWIITFASEEAAPPQISVAIDGGSGTPTPELSIEVDDLQEVIHRLQMSSIPIEYGPAVETWGVRRLYVRDPFGRLLNILEHI